jgi:hypothetical protein
MDQNTTAFVVVVAYGVAWVLFYALWLLCMGIGFWQLCKYLVRLGK